MYIIRTEIMGVISKSDMREEWVQVEIKSMTKIAQHEIQLPLYYDHFEITEFSQ